MASSTREGKARTFGFDTGTAQAIGVTGVLAFGLIAQQGSGIHCPDEFGETLY
jgi:hypothetical protein